MFSYEFCEISKTTCFYRAPPVAASAGIKSRNKCTLIQDRYLRIGANIKKICASNSIFKGYYTLVPDESKSTWNTSEKFKNFLRSEAMNENIN